MSFSWTSQLQRAHVCTPVPCKQSATAGAWNSLLNIFLHPSHTRMCPQMVSREASLLRQSEAAPEALSPALKAVQALGQALSLPSSLEQLRCVNGTAEATHWMQRRRGTALS